MFTALGIAFVGTSGPGCTHDLFDALDGIDPHFDSGGEDADFSLRARFELGIEPVIEQEAIYWMSSPMSPVKSLSKGFRN